MALKIHMWSLSCITPSYTKTSYGVFILKGPNCITPSHTKNLVKLSFQKFQVVLPHLTPKHILEFSFQRRLLGWSMERRVEAQRGQDCCHIVLFFRGSMFEFQSYHYYKGSTQCFCILW